MFRLLGDYIGAEGLGCRDCGKPRVLYECPTMEKQMKRTMDH